MSNLPNELRYAKTHEWMKTGPDGAVMIGITDYAQNSLGDITFIQLPKVGVQLKAGEPFGVIESVKTASDVYVPVGGAVIAVNTALDKAPETVNRDPYEAGWLIKVKPSNPSEAGSLLDAAAYAKLTE